MNEAIWSILGVVAIFLVLFVLGSIECDNKAVSFEAHTYKVLGGCMVKHEDKWLPLENIRGFD